MADDLRKTPPSDPNLKNNAIDMKLFIEEMREQTQNVE